MKKFVALFLAIVVFIFFISGCSGKQELTVDEILGILDNEGISYEEREVHPSEELSKTVENYVYELEEGRFRIHFFSSVDDRMEVEKDPYPAAIFMPNASYSKDKILLYYVAGNEALVEKLDKAFEGWN
ncbi:MULTISPECIES: hypothetical protein [Bacillaceae]|uniref:Lipoprotein n=1 Tax=Evansella alkalicola TaxID=745819 RepID=A0ABS6JT68_9BACI|nr:MULTISPECIES: hypothetical protein [Bacillaceae]MBU9720869.1 hypothetical protein [Bacillus alkalicola]